MPKVTVAIPTYNRKEYLREAIESVLKQTFQDFVIFVFDNSSDYDVQALLDEFCDDRIALFRASENIGFARNFDRALTYDYDSSYVVIFHDDDVMHPDLLAREVAIMDAHPEMVWIGTNLRFVHNDVDMAHFLPVESGEVRILDTLDLTRCILKGFNLCYDSVMYRTDRLDPIEELASRYAKWVDRPYLLTLSRKGSVGILSDPLVNYRLHPGQDSQTPAPHLIQASVNLTLFYKECLNDLQCASDKRLFYTYVANNLIPATFATACTWADVRQLLAPYRQNGLLRLHYLNARGLYRTIRAIIRRI